MSTPDKRVFLSNEIEEFYTSHLRDHGNSPQGVGWKNDEAQRTRFEQLAKIISVSSDFSINDLGCGTGQFYKFLLSNKVHPAHYFGYDILEDMIVAAKKELGEDNRTELMHIELPGQMRQADYSVASGIFNVRYGASETDWKNHVISTIEQMHLRSEKGFAFNLLTSYSDREYMQAYLYYADPLFYFDFCKRNFSKNVALLHDYGQYDFTILVRK